MYYNSSDYVNKEIIIHSNIMTNIANFDLNASKHAIIEEVDDLGWTLKSKNSNKQYFIPHTANMIFEFVPQKEDES